MIKYTIKFLRKAYRYLSTKNTPYLGLPVDFIGSNWAHDDKKTIAIFFGFNPWKREVVSAFFKQYKTAFVLGQTSYFKIRKELLNVLPEGQEVIFVTWGGRPLSWMARVDAKRRKIQTYSVEDGFLRSVGNGLLHTRPSSISIDKTGMYFDATRPSDLEKILNTYDFDADPALIGRARAGIDLFRSVRLTKYYDTEPYPATEKFKKTKKYSILVVGQVEDDASIITGRAKIKRNVELVLQARKDYPDADIYFRPHPDLWAGNRKGYSDIKRVESVCAIVPPDSSLYELFSIVDHVYTMTSLAGFEAILSGLKVTTFGMPFYAGWGLTEDRVAINRRGRNLSIEKLFAAVYFLYPQYIHQASDEESSFEESVGYFLVDILKDGAIFDLHKESRLFQEAVKHKGMLSMPFKLMAYLNETGNFAAGDTAKIIDLVTDNFKLSDYSQASALLYKTSNYDALVQYSNIGVDYVKENAGVLASNPILLESFLYSFAISLANSNGRRISELPDINNLVLSISGNSGNLKKIFENYVNCLALNLQYDVIEEFCEKLQASAEEGARDFKSHWGIDDFIKNALKIRLSSGNYRILAQTLLKKPSRSERDFAKRHQLTSRLSKKYIENLNLKFQTTPDAIFNQLLYWSLLDEESQAKAFFNELVELLKESGEHAFGDYVIFRKTEFFAFAQVCIKRGEFDVCEKIIASFADDKTDVANVFLRMNYLRAKGVEAEFLSYFDGLSREVKNDEKIIGVYARYLREIGLFERAKQCYLEMYKKAKTVAKRNNVLQEIQKIQFCQDSSAILNAVAQPKIPKGVIFLASQTCFNTLAMMIPSLVELKKKGYAVVNLMAGMTEAAPTGIEYVDQFSGIIPLRLSFYGLKNEWEVNWPEKKVRSKNINFYQGFYERLSVQSRRFHVDINASLINRVFHENLVRADTCLTICNRIFSEVVSRGIPVSFVSGNSHVTPFSVFRDFARQKNHPLLNFINCNVAYESYFSNLGSKFANTMCVTDMTLYPNIRAPFMARKDLFDAWFDKNKENAEFIVKAKGLINTNRVGSTSNDKELEIIEYIKAQKELGKKIVCAFGKVPVDLNVPYDGGPAHEDMADWISHTVEVCGQSENIILLVKPHPHELRPEISLDLVESFHDLITVDVKKNVHLLGHKDINGHALAPYLDLAILYNGSSSLELAAQGIPVLMASYFGKHDYPVDLNYPASRDDYREFILSENYPVPSEELRRKSAFLMCYLGTDEVSILNQYSLRQLTNDRVGVPKWRKEKIENFLKFGDPKMKLVADRIVEKFEKLPA